MTSPFLLANRPKNQQGLPQDPQQQSAAPSARNSSFDPAPLDARSAWEKVRDRMTEADDKQTEDQAIHPVAGTIPQSEYMDRFNPIRSLGEVASQGQISSSEYQRSRAAQIAANKLAAQQQEALMNAYKASANFNFGSYPNGTITRSGGGTIGMPGEGGYTGNVTYDHTDASIADMMRKAGFPESAIGIGLAVVQAESSGRENVTHANSNGTTDQGLWQINTVHADKYAGQNIFDPQVNTNIAYQVWKERGSTWNPWTTYMSGVQAHAVPASRLQRSVTAVPSYSGGVVTQGNGALRNQAVQRSMVTLNLPYVWGGESLTTGADCSGLVLAVYNEIGLHPPRTASEQSHWGGGTRVQSVNQLQPGDLVAFQWAGGYRGAGDVSHIAVYAGNNEIIESYGGDHGRRRSLGNSQQDQGAIYIHVRFPGE